MVQSKKTRLSRAKIPLIHQVETVDQLGRTRRINIPGEVPLTIKVDGREIITLMTMGSHPEELALGYLYNQRLLEEAAAIKSVEVDWDRQTAEVTTRSGDGVADLEEKRARMTVTSGCAQGTIFSCTVDKLYEHPAPRVEVRQSTIYRVLRAVASRNLIYRQAGTVHCACLCHGDRVIMSVEDVGRHNAVDAIAGRMWLEEIPGRDKILYLTGRLTSEMLMKAAFMGLPVIVSKSGTTEMGYELARDLGLVVIGRAKKTRFQIFSGEDQVIFDAVPQSETIESDAI